ncbi:MAG TPA: hypothetical protein VFI84_01950 [Candidatus Saccharimonadales bacterium]|nr:hypothetical protein [Candidatus Saccharimonadales bacterium]
MAREHSPALSEQLLLSVAEQLKLPLLQIARQAELGQLTSSPNLKEIQSSADTALRLIDSYVLGMRLALDEQESLMLEPVSVSSVLYDSAEQLQALAKFYGVKLELQVSGKFSPVMAHRKGLQAALVSLGASLIEALPALESPQLRLQLATHRCRYGIVAGLYSDTHTLTADALRHGRKLHGRSRQPLVGVTHTGAAGVFVADAILHAMRLKLQVSRHHNLYGLGAVLQPNRQLALV